MNVSKTLKNLFSFKWLSKLFSGEIVGTAAGTAVGAGFGSTILSIWGKLGDDTKQILLKKVFFVPPRADLMEVIHSINPQARKFWVNMLEKADKDIKTPAENDVATAWCKVLALRKERIPLKDKDGNPILIDVKDEKKIPIYINKPGLTNKELVNLLEQIADEGERSFWVWTNFLIHDPLAQKLDVIKRKILEGFKKLIESFEKIVGDTDEEIEKQLKINEKNVAAYKKKYAKRKISISL